MLAACANEAVIEYDSATDFSKFHTFAWRDSGEDLSDSSPEWHARIVNGIKTRLTTTGFREVDDSPDVYVTYYSAESQETFVVTDHMGYTISEIPEQNKETLNQMLDNMVEQWRKEQAKSGKGY